MSRRLTFFTLLAMAVLIAAACSSSGGGATASPTVAASAPASVAPSAEPSASETAEPSASEGETEETYKLEVATGSVGSYLTGEDGKTLYTFTNDTKDSGKSACNGDCAVNWPPLVLEADDEIEAEDGVNGTITQISRDDGSKQVAYNGMPLYYFKGDAAAGDTNGQGLNDKWFVAAP
jgi:predicted lipoprotein with Yx(FWY)xxD motif